MVNELDIDHWVLHRRASTMQATVDVPEP